jgi:hypothetical protein
MTGTVAGANLWLLVSSVLVASASMLDEMRSNDDVKKPRRHACCQAEDADLCQKDRLPSRLMPKMAGDDARRCYLRGATSLLLWCL